MISMQSHARDLSKANKEYEKLQATRKKLLGLAAAVREKMKDLAFEVSCHKRRLAEEKRKEEKEKFLDTVPRCSYVSKQRIRYVLGHVKYYGEQKAIDKFIAQLKPCGAKATKFVDGYYYCDRCAAYVTAREGGKKKDESVDQVS